jgi:hypothetical protein
VTFAYEPPIVSDYLVVKLEVKEAQQAQFEAGMQATLKYWEDPQTVQWKLLLAARGEQAHDAKRSYLHVWQTPSPMNLWQAMFLVASKSEYAALHKYIDSEEQDMMRFASPYAPGSIVPHKALIALQELQLVQDWFCVQDWQAGLSQLARAHRAGPRAWDLAFGLQSQTGRLRRHLQLWTFDAAERNPSDLTDWEKIEPSRPADSAIAFGQPAGSPAVLSRSKFAVYTVIDYRSPRCSVSPP